MSVKSKSFSVLTVSKRTGWEEMAANSIRRQTVQIKPPASWITVTENYGDFNFSSWGGLWFHLINAPSSTKPSNLNASLNEGLRHIDTDYVIFYQDFIELPEDCFEKLLNLATPRTFVTTCTTNYDGTDDGRYTGTNIPRPCHAREWEANVSVAPMQMLRDLGGFDEDYDNGWSWDNVNVAERAALLGAMFILDESNRPKLYPHEMSSHQTLEPNGDRHALTMRAIKAGKKPIKLPYLETKGGKRSTSSATLSNFQN